MSSFEEDLPQWRCVFLEACLSNVDGGCGRSRVGVLTVVVKSKPK